MSDEKLRELERRFKETGSVEDEATWLQERVRVGDLSQERLLLASRVGHPAARLLAPEVSLDTEPWNWDEASGLDDRLLRRLGADCSERALLWAKRAGREIDPRCWEILELARAQADGDDRSVDHDFDEITDVVDAALFATQRQAWGAAECGADAAAEFAESVAGGEAEGAERDWQCRRWATCLLLRPNEPWPAVDAP